MKKVISLLCMLLLLVTLLPSLAFAESSDMEYLVGAGIHDITGPSAEIVMMGYADSNQSNRGIHLRQRARSFVVVDQNTDERIVYVSTDLGMAFQSVKDGVVNKLSDNGYGHLYRDQNIMINATHTHSGPGGYSHYGLYNVSTFGFIEENYDCIVNGIYESIVKAHNNLEPGYIEFNMGQCLDTNINRSPEAYEMNPEEEKALYEYNVDKNMYVLNFKNADDDLLGILNWFGVHPTSMGVDNLLISSDNKGTASYLYEKEMGTDYLSSKTFVAAFAQSNCGDSSPNIFGGPTGYGDDDFESTYEAGRIQYEKAKELSDTATKRLTGPIAFRHQYVDFSNLTIAPEYADGEERYTYPGCMGYSFARGAEDNPTDLPGFYEGMTQPEYGLDSADNYIDNVQGLLNLAPKFNQINGARYPELWELHYPKPILFATCKAEPDPWTPQIIPVQLFTIGDFAILGVPAEVTTMSGRRLKNAVEEAFLELTGDYYTAVVSGHSNSYTSYLTTPEEYDAQHYEGASTQFGKWTLSGYLQQFYQLATSIVEGSTVPSGPHPPDLSDEQVTFETGVLYDGLPIARDFGDLKTDVETSYHKGDTVTASFWSGHPRNDLRTGNSFLEVQYKDGDKWITIAYDWDWDTKYHWKRRSVIAGTSESIIEWTIPDDALLGTYRVKHNGAYKSITGIYQYEGYSSEFIVE
ncbi:neutral/alkaline ceramidase [Vallitalea okinawensis]|uniref:neutral/alkaline ceramidase n=1 Tax=Vallitalea okinawensis TaxID=2078660 RepID=UPI001478DBFC|nr:neutral/alkaline non-lysosomal ceramidase N-terminal domain-containing protein [Vallitalea okinawensis]